MTLTHNVQSLLLMGWYKETNICAEKNREERITKLQQVRFAIAFFHLHLHTIRTSYSLIHLADRLRACILLISAHDDVGEQTVLGDVLAGL